MCSDINFHLFLCFQRALSFQVLFCYIICHILFSHLCYISPSLTTLWTLGLSVVVYKLIKFIPDEKCAPCKYDTLLMPFLFKCTKLLRKKHASPTFLIGQYPLLACYIFQNFEELYFIPFHLNSTEVLKKLFSQCILYHYKDNGIVLRNITLNYNNTGKPLERTRIPKAECRTLNCAVAKRLRKIAKNEY
jgi:hypothetical protein